MLRRLSPVSGCPGLVLLPFERCRDAYTRQRPQTSHVSFLPNSFSRSPKCSWKRCIVFFLLGWKNVTGLEDMQASFHVAFSSSSLLFIQAPNHWINTHFYANAKMRLSLSATAPRGLGNLLEHCWTSPLSLRRSLPMRVLTQTRGRVTQPTELPVSRPGHRAPQGDVATSLASPGKAEGLQQRRCVALCCGRGHGPPAGPLDRPAPGRAQRPGESEHQGGAGEKPAAQPSRPVARCPVFSWSVIWKAVRCRAAPIGI